MRIETYQRHCFSGLGNANSQPKTRSRHRHQQSTKTGRIRNTLLRITIASGGFIIEFDVLDPNEASLRLSLVLAGLNEMVGRAVLLAFGIEVTCYFSARKTRTWSSSLELFPNVAPRRLMYDE